MVKENCDHVSLFYDRLIPITGILGVFIYIISITVPSWLNTTLVFVSFCGILVALFGECSRFSLKLPLVLPIAIFVLLSFLSVLLSIDFKTSLEPTLLMVPTLIIYFLIVELFNIKLVKLLYLTFSIVAIIISITLLQVFFDSHAHSRFVWIAEAKHPLLVVPNDLIFISLIAPLSFSLFYKKPFSVIGLLAFISLLLSISIIVFFQSRGAVLTLLFSLGCVALLLWPKRLKALTVLVVLVFMFIGILILVDKTQDSVLLNRFINDLWTNRLRLWIIAWYMFLDEPLFGHGIQTFRLLLNSYGQVANVHAEVTSWAHNLYIETVVGQGIVGLVSLLSVLVSSLWISWKTTRQAKSEEVRILSTGALAAMLGFCFAAFFEITFLRYWSVTLFFSLLAIITVLYFLGNFKDAVEY